MKPFKKNFLLAFLPVLAHAQNNFIDIDHVADQLLLNTRAASTEQIILQTNKKLYAPNENIWFKAFEVDSLTGRLRNTSKILFADLVDAKDKVLHHLELNIADGQQGSAFLPDSSLSGFYWIRAYTQNILHHNINNIAVQPVLILSADGKVNYPVKAAGTNAAATDKDYRITVYPEGGCLMSGAPSLVAVKLTDSEERPVADSILIKDNRGEILARFSTNDQGLGKFVFEPSPYKKYGLFVLRDNHYDSIASLPRIDPYAVQLAVTEQTDASVKLRVLLEDSVYSQDYKTFLIALHQDSIYLGAEGKGNYEFSIPASKFAGGITHFMLYDVRGKLLSARDLYINKNDVTVEMQTDNTLYGAREKVNMNLSVTQQGRPVVSVVSVSVNDSRVTDSLNSFSVDTLANMPASNVDLLMLTQARPTNFYTEPLNDSADNAVADNLYIRGVLLNKKNEPASRKPVLLISKAGFIMEDTTSDAGKFSFELASFTTGTPFTMQANGDNSTKDDYHFVLDSAVNFDFKTPPALKRFFSPEQLQNIKKTESFYMNSLVTGEGWLPAVTVKTKTSLQNTNGFPETIIPKEVLHSGRVNNVADAVLQFSKLHVVGGYLMAGGPNGFRPGPTDEPEIVMDGSRIGSASESGSVLGFLRTISTSGIDHIRILTGASAASYGVLPGTGVIEIYSASSSTYANPLTGGLTTIYPRGFDAAPEFGMPDYSDKRLKNSKDYDARTAVYWKDDVITDENGNATVDFFTSDTPATYIVTVSGITAKGDKIFKTFTINRK